MAPRRWSMQEAKNRFSEVAAAARRAPQTVTEHGKPTVVVVDVVDYERPSDRGGPRGFYLA